jgi:uncharacterized protein YgiM (DUF1202 family)
MTRLDKRVRAVVGVVALTLVFVLALTYVGDYRAARRSTKVRTGASGTSSGTQVVVVLMDGLNFRATASGAGRPIRGLSEGDRLVLIATEGDWHHVKDDKGVEGYVSSNTQYTRVEAP